MAASSRLTSVIATVLSCVICLLAVTVGTDDGDRVRRGEDSGGSGE